MQSLKLRHISYFTRYDDFAASAKTRAYGLLLSLLIELRVA
jgi:hypothetical protein